MLPTRRAAALIASALLQTAPDGRLLHMDQVALLALCINFLGAPLIWALERRLPALDANDLWYQVNASYDYDPSAGLERITAPMTWINSADDFINPPELGLAEQFVPRIAGVQYRLVPNSPGGKGHGTHTWAVFWKQDLIDLLARTGD